ncbi:transcriptional activator RfaH [Parasphingorhabdus sp.]|uniref:transcription termination/antitermination protein NusG n=1 Tax=Parasphingorhabdus sp. TaxID=2709688 RepID=UPI0032664AD7
MNNSQSVADGNEKIGQAATQQALGVGVYDLYRLILHPNSLPMIGLAGIITRMEEKRGNSELIWHLAQYKPNCAMIAKHNLARQGFEVFLPLETNTRISRGKFIEKIMPFFPGYLFVGLADGSSPLNAIRSTYGVSQLVRFGTKAADVPAQLIVELKSRCNKDGLIGKNVIFEEGEKVRVTDGPFANLVGQVERTVSDRRVWLLLDVMGKKTKVSVARPVLQAKA